MILDKLNYNFNADRYGITEEELEGLELEKQVELVINKMEKYIDEQMAAKNEFDDKRNEHLTLAEHYQKERSKAKGKADQASTQLITFRKNFKERIDLINYKANKK